MAVYVDSARIQYGRMKMCHMIADTVGELHAMAWSLGLKKKWFQDKASFPHYDICWSKRKKALSLGVIPVNRRELVAHMRRIRSEHERQKSSADIQVLDTVRGIHREQGESTPRVRHYRVRSLGGRSKKKID